MEHDAIKLSSSTDLPQGEHEAHRGFMDDVWNSVSQNKELAIGGALAAGALATYGALHGNFASISELGALAGKASTAAAEDTGAALSKSAAKGVGIIDLGGGINEADMARYLERAGLKAPEIKMIGVDGAKLSPDPEASENWLWPHEDEVPGVIKFDASAPPSLPPKFEIDWTAGSGTSMSRGMEREWTPEDYARINEAMKASAERGIAITKAETKGFGITVTEAH